MALEIVQYGALKDNYNYLLRDGETGTVAVIDPSEAAPTVRELEARGWPLHMILNTHHHWDHTDGNAELKVRYGAEVYGYAGDAARIAGLDHPVQEGDTVLVGNAQAAVLFVPGHTSGHIAFHFAKDKALFCGDTLFLMGCGRLFEGTPQQMHHSLQKLAALPDDTQVYCGHEYTSVNGKFSQSVDPNNAALKERMNTVRRLRAKKQPTVPAPLGLEKATNPFLRPDDTGIRQHLGMEGAPAVEVFARIRDLKDRF